MVSSRSVADAARRLANADRARRADKSAFDPCRSIDVNKCRKLGGARASLNGELWVLTAAKVSSKKSLAKGNSPSGKNRVCLAIQGAAGRQDRIVIPHR